jgi:hypothetical protein
LSGHINSRLVAAMLSAACAGGRPPASGRPQWADDASRSDAYSAYSLVLRLEVGQTKLAAASWPPTTRC